MAVIKDNKKNSKPDGRTLHRLLEYTAPHRKFLILSFISSAISVVLTLWIPVLTGHAVDCAFGPGDVDFAGVAYNAVLMAIAAVGSALFGWLASYFNNLITFRTASDLRDRMFSKITTLPLSHIDTTPHGDLINRVTSDIDLVSDGLLQGLTQLLTGVLTIAGTLIVMLATNLTITVIVVVLTPLSLFVASFIVRGSVKHFREQTETQGELGGCLNEYLSNIRIVKQFGYEDEANEIYDGLNMKLKKCGFIAQFYSALTNPTTRFVNNIVYAAVGVAGGLFAISGVITIGTISMFLSYANQYTKPFNEISGIMSQLTTALASADRVFKLLDTPSEEPDTPDDIDTVDTDGRVAFEDVSFSYVPDKPLIEHLSLNAEPGSRVAIVGPTGCGKTTLINLLMRFYDVRSGRITSDGTDIRDIRRDTLRRRFSMVLQDSWLFTGTVRENIAYGKPDATDEEIRSAAERARADSFIERLPNGYDTVISDDGGLSQGQRQLLNIARAILLDAPVLILDEATSNIDTRTEILVQRAFNEMMEGRTSFVVAHRLSTIKSADMILVMNSGKIVEQGRHEQLVNSGGFYAQLWQAMTAEN